jgi:APA family basic amino acid/polyamine antiporter
VAAGETQDPRRDLPRALITGLVLVAVLYGLIQMVCIGTLPQLATSQRPIVDAGRTFLGPAGTLIITLGAAISMLGTLNGSMITISRVPYAMAAAGQLPRAPQSLVRGDSRRGRFDRFGSSALRHWAAARTE